MNLFGVMAEPQTHGDAGELLRTLGFAAAPGLFYGFAAMQIISPYVVVIVSAWTIAASVLAVRQALDYSTTSRAVGVCVAGWLIVVGMGAAIELALTRSVS